MTFLPKKLQSRFDSELYSAINPTQALDAIEQALRELSEGCIEFKRRDGVVGSFSTESAKLATEALTNLATLRQQVGELMAFREAHRPCVSRIEHLEHNINYLQSINTHMASALCNIQGLTTPPPIVFPTPPAAGGA